MYSILKIMCFLNIKACQHILLHQIHKIMLFKKASYDPFKVKVNQTTYELNFTNYIYMYAFSRYF